MKRPRDRHSVARSDILRRATLYSVAFVVAGLVVAVAGSALVAWMLSRTGLPFRTTWLVVALIVILPGLTAAVINTIRGR